MRTSYNVAESHWQGDPELSSLTGDVVDLNFAVDPKRAGISDDGKWMVIESRAFDEKKADYSTRFHVLDLSASKHYEGESLRSVIDVLKTKEPLSSIKLQPIEILFDSLLVTYLEKTKR